MNTVAAVNASARPPRGPICRSAEDEAQPCRFWQICVEQRQRLHHYATPAIRGAACWKYQQLEEQRQRAEREAQRDPNVQIIPVALLAPLDPEALAERAAIQAEGEA